MTRKGIVHSGTHMYVSSRAPDMRPTNRGGGNDLRNLHGRTMLMTYAAIAEKEGRRGNDLDI